MSYLLKVRKKLSCYIMVVLSITSSVGFSDNNDPSQVLSITENKRLEANIAVDVMNRLTVVNDRIVNIFGDDGTFVVQTDEHTGQVFIKPTTENGNKPLSITLITENGITQDLTLNPVKLKPTTLILKPFKPTIQYSQSPAERLIPGVAARNQTLQDQWIQVMKQAVLGELAVVTTGIFPKARKVVGFNLSYDKSYQIGELLVQVWSIKNITKIPQELQENRFFQVGDLALSLQQRWLQPNEKTFAYILIGA